MADRRFGWVLACAGGSGRDRAATTVPGSGSDDRGDGDHYSRRDHDDPGRLNSLLGMLPGSSGVTFGTQPGRDDLLLGRIGTAAPRVPTSITTPGGTYQGPSQPGRSPPTQPIPVPRPLLYGSLELPEDERKRDRPTA